MRTAEQVAADNALDDAIRACCVAYDRVDADELVVSWVVVVGLSSTEPDHPGATVVLEPDGQAVWSSVGLLHLAAGDATDGRHRDED